MTDDMLFGKRYRIPSARYKGWDYRWAGVYSVTICTRGRVCWFGEVQDGQVSLSTIGQAVMEEWQKIPRHHPRVSLDEWIMMPDHMHGILVFKDAPEISPTQDQSPRLLSQSLGAVINRFKSDSTKRIWYNLKQRDFAWQTRFYDTILRDQDHLHKIRTYIQQNPLRW